METEATIIWLTRPFRTALAPLAGMLKDNFPPGLEELLTLPDEVEAVKASFHTKGEILLRLTLEQGPKAGKSESQMVKATLGWARKALPPGMAAGPQMPPTLVRSVVAVADKLTGGVDVAAEGVHLVLTWPRPDDLKSDTDRPVTVASV